MHQGLLLTQQLHPRSFACIQDMYINTLTFSKPLVPIPLPQHQHTFLSASLTKSVLVLRERNWYYHDNPARENLFKTFSFKLHSNRPRSAMISSDPGQRPGKLEHNVSQPGHRWIYAIFASAWRSGKHHECHLTVFVSIFQRCVENIPFRGHVLALNFGLYNQDKPFKKKTWKPQILEKITWGSNNGCKRKYFKKSRNSF